MIGGDLAAAIDDREDRRSGNGRPVAVDHFLADRASPRDDEGRGQQGCEQRGAPVGVEQPDSRSASATAMKG